MLRKFIVLIVHKQNPTKKSYIGLKSKLFGEGGVYFSKFKIIIFILFSKKQKNLFKICMLWNVRKFFNNTIRSEMQQVFGG